MGLLSSFVTPGYNPGQLDYFDVGSNIFLAGSGSLGGYPTANMASFYLFKLGKPMTATGIRVFIGATGSGDIDVGIYRKSGSDMIRLASSGAVTVAGTGDQAIPFTAPYALAAGVEYYAAVAATTTSMTFNRLPATAGLIAMGDFGFQLVSSMPLPATASSVGTYTGAFLPMLRIY